MRRKRSGFSITRSSLIAGAACVLFIALSSCQTYRPEPLTPSNRSSIRLDRASLSSLRIKAQNVRHPGLPACSIDLQDGISPDEAAVLAVLGNPNLRAKRDELGVARAQTIDAGILPNPTLSGSVDVPVGGQTDGAVVGVGVGIDWDVSSLVGRSALVGAQREQSRSVELRIAWEEWQVALEAKLAVFRRLAAERRLRLAQRVLDRQEREFALIKQAASGGNTTQLAVAASTAALHDARLAVLRLQREVEAARLALNRILGAPAHAALALQRGLELPDHLDLPKSSDLAAGLESQRLDMVALRIGYESQEKRLRAAILRSFPSVGIGLNTARDTGDLYTIGAGVSVGLPLFDRHQGAVSIGRATRRQLKDQYAARLFEARADIANLVTQARSVQARLVVARDGIGPQQHLVDVYQAAVQSGQVDFLNYYQAWKDLTRLRALVIELQAQLAETVVALQMATGRYQLRAVRSPGGQTSHASSASHKQQRPPR